MHVNYYQQHQIIEICTHKMASMPTLPICWYQVFLVLQYILIFSRSILLSSLGSNIFQYVGVHMQYDTSFLKVTWNIIVLEHHVASFHFDVY